MGQQMPILVNGEAVSEALLAQEIQLLRDRYEQQMGAAAQEQEPQILADARENAAERLLLIQEARKQISAPAAEELEARFLALQHQLGGAESKSFSRKEEAQIKKDLDESIRLERYFEQICRDVDRPSESDSRAYYAEHAKLFHLPERVHVGHIVQRPSEGYPLETVYAALLNAREQLLAGGDFGELAATVSHCADGSYDLGWIVRGQMVPSFEAVAFATKVNEISDVFQTEFGYHVLTVWAREEARVRPYEEVRYEIEAPLFDAWKNEAIGKVVDRLRETATLENLRLAGD